MPKAKSKGLNYRRKLLRIPLEYKKKYARIFLKDLMRKIQPVNCVYDEFVEFLKK